jgi:TonB family protein
MIRPLGLATMFLLSCVQPQGEAASAPVASPPIVKGGGSGNKRPFVVSLTPEARYLNAIHSRIHPIFADGYLSALDRRSREDPVNDPKRFTRLEIVLGRDGGIVALGVVKTSGLAEFDAAALDTFARAQPFAAPPQELLSADGNAYIHWELHRDEVYACSTMNARPFLLTDKVRPDDQAGTLQL